MKLSDDQVSEVLRRWNAEEVDQYELAAAFGVSQATISNIVTGRRRAHVKSVGRAPQGLITAEGRECSGPCGLFKAWSEFSPNPRARLTGYQSACKLCRNRRKTAAVARSPRPTPTSRREPSSPMDHRLVARAWHLQGKYGITLEQYALLSEQQGHKCALCNQPETARRRVARNGTVRVVDLLGIDHDHACERHAPAKACRWCIRGLLCDDCNRMLGFAERKPAVAVRFTDYLGLRPLLREGGEAQDVVLSVTGS
jgi:Recombination endonuclease VII